VGCLAYTEDSGFTSSEDSACWRHRGFTFCACTISRPVTLALRATCRKSDASTSSCILHTHVHVHVHVHVASAMTAQQAVSTICARDALRSSSDTRAT
jgi:hypothetical protein